MARQIATGHFVLHLDPPAETWVRELWDSGLFPLEAPFVYELRGRRFIVFPLLFPIVTAPFYSAFGFRGLYVVPLVSLWLTWVRFHVVARRAGVKGMAAALGLSALVFASPLTPYGSIYWEHTLAVALGFTGLTMLVPPAGLGSRRAALSGTLLLCLAGLVREELFCLAAAAGGAALVSPYLRSARAVGLDRTRRVVILTLAGGALMFLLANWLVYRRPLGAHSIPSLEDFPGQSRLGFAVFLLATLTAELFRYFPAGAFVLLGTVPWFVGIWPMPPTARLWGSVGAAFMVGVAALSPSTGGNQWGPRLLLPVVPLAALLSGMALQALLGTRRRGLRWMGLSLFGALCALGLWRNTIEGTSHLRRVYSRRAVPLARLRAIPVETVAVSHPFIAQQLAALFRDKRLFLTTSGRGLRQLAAALAARGQPRFLFVCDPVYSCGPVTAETESITIPHRGPPLLKLTRMEALDRYILFEGEVLRHRDPPHGTSWEPPRKGPDGEDRGLN